MAEVTRTSALSRAWRALTVAIVVMALVVPTGCAPGGSGTPGAVPNADTGGRATTSTPVPKEVARIPLPSGAVATFSSANPLSPDGNWVAVATGTQNKGQHLWLFSAAGGAGKAAGEVSPAQVVAGTLVLRHVGWTSGSELVFARQGTQPYGSHKGARGVSVRVMGPETGEVREAGWTKLKSRLPTLWTNSYFVSTVGGAPPAMVKQYIESGRRSESR